MTVPSEDPTLQCNLPVDGSGWVELLLKEMMGAASIDDARARASRVLESLEKSISLRAGAESTQNIQKVGIIELNLVLTLTRSISCTFLSICPLMDNLVYNLSS